MWGGLNRKTLRLDVNIWGISADSARKLRGNKNPKDVEISAEPDRIILQQQLVVFQQRREGFIKRRQQHSATELTPRLRETSPARHVLTDNPANWGDDAEVWQVRLWKCVSCN